MDHKRAAQHFTKVALHHAAIAKAAEKCGAMAKAAKDDVDSLDLDQLDELLESFIENHSAIGDECADYAECCAKCAKEADAEKASVDAMFKAASGAAPSALEGLVRAAVYKMLGNTVIPSSVSVVAPTRPGLVAVKRPGQPDLPAAPAVPDVPPEFQKLFSTVDED
jgi:hypothetical protein